ncbi:acyl-CoA dehydrogenase family protein [Kribbella sp. NPDC050820]|uniref:acyl-CoA dehydrogenase family protein n=1 Tax=Kribbella sp. NPDC050820 TaxID=3155408 RepID=UPI0033D712DF
MTTPASAMPARDLSGMRGGMWAVTPVGAALAQTARALADDLARVAVDPDHERSFPQQRWAKLRRSGLLGATVPGEFGGPGCQSVHDLCVVVSTVAGADPSTALGLSMHLAVMWSLTAGSGLALRDQLFSDPAGRVLLRGAARGRMVACLAISELGRPLAEPRTTAIESGGRMRVTGTKSFCTNSPAADLFVVLTRISGLHGTDDVGIALVPRGTPGVQVVDDWRGLGMAASGSGTVRFADCDLERRLVVPLGTWGETPAHVGSLSATGTVVAAAVFLGIAERAQQLAIEHARRRASSAVELLGRNEVDLFLMRSAIAQATGLVDTGPTTGRWSSDDLQAALCSASLGVRQLAVGVVDRALTCVGGAGYVADHPLATLYRDVRAGGMLRPYSFLDGPRLLGTWRLGLSDEQDAP